MTARGWLARRWQALLGVAMALLAIAGIAVGIRTGAERRALAERVHGGRILVADLDNGTPDSLLAGAVGEVLRVDLAQSPLIAVMSARQVRGALGRMERADAPSLTDSLARELALREGIRVYVSGAFDSVGQGYVVSARLVSAHDEEVLAALKGTAADSTGLLQAVHRVAAALRRRLGESMMAAATAPPLERVTTRSLEALRWYSEAVRVAEREDNERRAYGLLREAVAKDNSFAMAWHKLAGVAADIGELGTAQVALNRAFQHRERLPVRERYFVMGDHFTRMDQPDDALRAYASLLEVYPNDVRALVGTGLVYAQKRDFRRAEEFRRRALAADTTIPSIYSDLALDLLNQGKLDSAAWQVRETLRRFPDLERALWLEVDIAMARWDLETAEGRTRELMSAAPADYGRQARGLRTLATLALMGGRVREAEAHLLELEPLLRREGTAGERVILAATRGLVESWYRRSGDRGVVIMEQSLAGIKLDTVPLPDRHNAWRGYVYALAGRPARALALAAEARKLRPEGIGRDAELLRTEGAARLVQNRVPEAVALLRRSVDGHFCPVCSLPDLARAYERAGRPDSAIASYQRYVDTPWSERWAADGEFQGHALLRLGELREQRGDGKDAAAAYRRFIELWGAADPEMQPMVNRVRERLKVLEEPGRGALSTSSPGRARPRRGTTGRAAGAGRRVSGRRASRAVVAPDRMEAP